MRDAARIAGDWLSNLIGLAGNYPLEAALLAIVLLFLVRRDLLRMCDNSLKPLAALLGTLAQSTKAAAQRDWRGGWREWHAVGLFTGRGAPSHLIIGCAGAAMVGLSIYLSSAFLDTPLHLLGRTLSPSVPLDVRSDAPPAPPVPPADSRLSHSGDPDGSESTSGTKDSGQQVLHGRFDLALLIAAFEVILAFLSLEFFGLTHVFNFRRKFHKGVCIGAGSFLLLSLAGVAAAEAALNYFMVEDAQSRLCVAYKINDAPCIEPSQPGAGPLSKAADGGTKPEDQPNSDPGDNEVVAAALVVDEIETLGYIKWVMVAVSTLLPFAYLIVGLAFDFFEELLSALNGLAQSVFLLALSGLLALAFRAVCVISIALRATLRVATLPILLGMRAPLLLRRVTSHPPP